MKNSEKLKLLAQKNRLKALKLYKKANAGHIGATLSCLDLMTFLHFSKIKKNDLFLLSKGHAACGLYSILNEKGAISDKELNSFYIDGTKLAAHPNSAASEEILFSTGSLGHGLPICCGLAVGSKLKNSLQNIFCLMSDGECNEGSTWEAFAFASHHKLSNLYAIVDKNGIQGFGYTKDVMNFDNLKERIESFGWEVLECSGHNFNELEQTFTSFKTNKPKCIIANTIKGKGVSFMENTIDWHYLPMTDEQYAQACKEVGGA